MYTKPYYKEYLNQDNVEFMQTTLLPNLNQEREPQKVTRPSLLLIVMLAVLVCGFLFLDAILPLRGLWFYDALLHTQVGTWLLLPTHLLFPGKATVFFQAGK